MESSISSAHPPFLDEKNYLCRKIRVKVYIKAIDEKAWQAILTRQSPPTVTTKDETLKSKETWTKEEDSLANNNFKALNVIFVVVDVTRFKLISACESAKDA